MSHIVTTHFAPMDGACDVKAHFTGPGGDIPIVEIGFASEWYASPTIQIALGNHDNPVYWLRETAARLLTLATEISVQAVAPANAEQVNA